MTIFFTTICLALFVFFIYSIKHILIFIKEEHFLLRLVQTFYFTTFRRSTMEAGRERDYVKKSNFCHWIFVKGIFYHNGNISLKILWNIYVIIIDLLNSWKSCFEHGGIHCTWNCWLSRWLRIHERGSMSNIP